MAITDGLIAWWDGEDETDSHTGGHDFLEINTPTYVSAKVGNGFQPARSGNKHWRINNADASAFDMGTGDYTVAFWLEQVNHTGNHGIWEYGDANNGANGDPGITIWSNTDDDIIIWIADGTNPKVGGKLIAGMTGGAYYCIILEFDRDANVSMYLGNTLADTIDISSLDGSNLQPTGDLFLGSASAGKMDNIVDSVAVWNRLLGSTDRSTYYNSGTGVSYADISSSFPIGSIRRRYLASQY